MSGFIWSIFNILFFIAFVYFFFKVIFRGIRQLSPKQRIYASPILLIGIIAMIGNSGKSDSTSTTGPGVDYELQSITIPRSFSNKLAVTYYINKITGELQPTQSNSALIGLVIGREWKHFNLVQTPMGLELRGSMHYSLLGIEFFEGGMETLYLE
ncbi:hypothetical protein [Algoriphagus algorifonticola]|uniref:hypothetical protein n=1 Tax=Algoriphagus algorifonticola TaxID=2593007 RepID=UPI0011A291E8|nr:hypothetical protein [Algoriphagus algorifonticola]